MSRQSIKKAQGSSPPKQSDNGHEFPPRFSAHPLLAVQRALAEPDLLTPTDVLTLQRTIGNRATVNLIAPRARSQPDLQPSPTWEQAQTEQRFLPQSKDIVQRVVRIDGDNVVPDQFQACLQSVRALIESNKLTWTAEHASLLTQWLQSREIITAETLDALAFNLFYYADNDASWQNMHRQAISKSEMDEAQHRRKRRRMASVLEPSTVQTPMRVPGLAKLMDTELLRLTEKDREEEEYWIRRPNKDLVTAKKRKLPEASESRIVAAGDKDDPSYVVWKNDRQLGHRYKGSGKKKKHTRTYGSKKAREGYEYKGTGLVDGHSIQVQDDQPILGPFQSDAPNWETTVPKLDGTTVTYPDTPYLPKNEKDTAWIEKHPYNFYWENQEQGKHFRQKGIEAPALKNKTSFLHFNTYTGDTFNPNSGSASDHIYPVPSHVDYLLKDTKGSQQHLSVDNRPTADYSKPKQFDKKQRLYPEVPGGKPSASKNKSLGGWSVEKHLELAKQANTSGFPFSTVLYPRDSGFDFQPEFRHELPGYQSPPPSPFHVQSALEEKEMSLTGKHSHLIDFEYGSYLVEDAKHNTGKDETSLTLSSIKTAKTDKMSSDGTGFRDLQKNYKVDAAAPGIVPGTEYRPTTAQEAELVARNRRLEWIIPDGFCIFSSLGAAVGQTGQAIQTAILQAIAQDTNGINSWIQGWGGGVYTVDEIRTTVQQIYRRWGTDPADMVLELAARVIGQGVTVLNPDGTTTDVNGGGHLLIRVETPNPHYHATRI